MNFDLIIVGGGLAGAALAVALRRTPLKIALIEQTPPRRLAELGSADLRLQPRECRLPRRTGGLGPLDHTRLAPVAEMHIHGDAGGERVSVPTTAGSASWRGLASRASSMSKLWESLETPA